MHFCDSTVEKTNFRKCFPENVENIGILRKLLLSEVGFEPTPTYVDCDLNAAP